MPCPNGDEIRDGASGLGDVFDKRKVRWLLGETLRDIGILLVVFAPLDAFFRNEPTALLPLALLFTCGLLFIALGIILETVE